MSRPIRLMTLAPGHFHAALVQKEMAAELHPRVHVYAPIGEDVLAHLARVTHFNNRSDRPTKWDLDLRLGENYLARFLRELPGTAVVIAGRNKPKIDLILASAQAPVHVLADKPWIIDEGDFDKLIEVRRQTDLRDLLVMDMMTERHEITSILLRDLIKDRDVFGALLPGTPDDPGLTIESTHYLKKQVADVPLRRPAWWFDAHTAGVGLTDVGTHLADLSMWLLYPEQSIDYRSEVQVYDASVWPTPLSKDQFREVTGLTEYPNDMLTPWISGDLLLYQGNGSASYMLRGTHVRMTVTWDYEAGAGQLDSQEVNVRGTQASLTVRPGPTKLGGTRPELYVTATDPANHKELVGAIKRRCMAWEAKHRGLGVTDHGRHVQVTIPDYARTNHEQHFGEVLGEFLRMVRNPRWAPAWEWPNLMAKYCITTSAARLARQKQRTGI